MVVFITTMNASADSSSVYNITPTVEITTKKDFRERSVRRSSWGPHYQTIIERAQRMGISVPVIEHVARRESTFNCSAYNASSGASGALQILPSSARAIAGYNIPISQLRTCGIGLTVGLAHLRLCVDRVGQNPARAGRCHESGPGVSLEYARKYINI